MKGLEGFLRSIDTVNNRIGKVISWLFIPMAVTTIYEVIARYVFNSPTVWVWDVNLQIFGIVILLGGGYTLLREKHVRIDVVVNFLPKKAGLVLELMGMLLLMFVAVVLTWQGGIKGWESFVTKEVLDTIWAPPIWYLKLLFPVAGVLLFFQGLRRFIRDLLSLLGHSQAAPAQTGETLPQ